MCKISAYLSVFGLIPTSKSPLIQNGSNTCPASLASMLKPIPKPKTESSAFPWAHISPYKNTGFQL